MAIIILSCFSHAQMQTADYLANNLLSPESNFALLGDRKQAIY